MNESINPREPVYKHSSGLIFKTARMVSSDEKESYDITLVVLWMPGNATTPMEIIGWHCGEPDIYYLRDLADEWCAAKTEAELIELCILQDMADC